MFAKWSDTLAGAVLLIVAVVMYQAAEAAGSSGMSEVDFSLPPRLVALALGALSLLLMLKSVRSALQSEAGARASKPMAHPVRLAASILLITLAGMAFEPLGFLPTAMLYLFAQGYVLSYAKSEFKPVRMLMFAVLAPLIINYVFGSWLSMPLPEGIL